MMNLLYMLPLNLLIYNMYENRDNSRLCYKKFALGQYQNKLEVDHALKCVANIGKNQDGASGGWLQGPVP